MKMSNKVRSCEGCKHPSNGLSETAIRIKFQEEYHYLLSFSESHEKNS